MRKGDPATLAEVSAVINIKKTCALIDILLPVVLQYTIKPTKRKNWITNLIKFEITIEIGKINLGKYTFPKIEALVTKISEVFNKQAEK